MSKAKIASDVYGVRMAAKAVMDVPYSETDKVTDRITQPGNVKGSFTTEHPEKQSRAPKSPNGKEDRREVSHPNTHVNQPRHRVTTPTGFSSTRILGFVNPRRLRPPSI
jgi:hypothetical protein